MIYSFIQYLRNQFSPGVFLLTNQIVNTTVPNDFTLITSTQCLMTVSEPDGSQAGYPDMKVEATSQFVVYGKTDGSARDSAFSVYNYLRDRHNVTLPFVTGTSPVVAVNRIHAMQKPYYFGKDERGLSRYGFNVLLIYSDGTYM